MKSIRSKIAYSSSDEKWVKDREYLPDLSGEEVGARFVAPVAFHRRLPHELVNNHYRSRWSCCRHALWPRAMLFGQNWPAESFIASVDRGHTPSRKKMTDTP